MSIDVQRAAVLEAHRAWEAGDFDRFMSFIAEDILYLVNVDGQSVPYAMSAVGKTDVADRLQLLLDTFDVTTFAVETVVHEACSTRTRVHGVYRHKKTGEVLDIRVRFRCWVEEGLLVRIEETHDARYVEAFERFVFHMQIAASGHP
jgi:ketosteroid isomerase-like protein